MSVDLKSSSKRNELKPRREPYWHRIEAGLFVGYRRIETGKGTWIARRRNDEGKQQYKALGTIDTLDKAVSLASAWAASVEQGVQHTTTTVKMACEAYVLHLKEKNTKASSEDAEGRFKRLVYDEPIGKIALDKLRTTALRTWMQKQLNDDGDEEDLRRSKDSANRNLNTLKAALNLALKDRLVANDSGWRTVSIFPKAGKRRTGDLSPADLQNLLKSCKTVQIAGLVRALMLTAVRPGEIAAANVGDFNKDQGSMVLTGKTGTRTVTLSTAAVEFFKECAKDKLPGAPLLTDEYGNRWNKDSWKKPFREACVAAELPDDVVMYTLRHAAISNMIAGGVDTFVVARLAGTSTTMIDKHYGHLRHDQTRAKLDQAHAATG
jgi:integrase